MDNTLLQTLAKKLNLTDLDSEKEPYILTPEEENSVIENEIVSAKKQKAWKLAQFDMLSEGEILARIAAVDWMAEINREDILSRANSSKNYNIWQREQREKEKAEIVRKNEEVKQRCDARYFYNLMAWTSSNEYGKRLIVHEDNKRLIASICFFLSGDERFETELGYSLKKGLLIRGISGLGKTHLIRCVEKNELSPIFIISTLEITDIVKAEGEYTPPIGDKHTLYLDDVGTEEHVVNHFGTKISWVKNFIELFYLNCNRYNKLIISTNNNFKDIEDKYGFRVRSRIKDMFNIIDVSGKDMRG